MCATTAAEVESSAIFQISRKLDPLSGMVKYSSLKPAGPTELEEPPLLVVGSRNNCSVMAPVSASRANAETYPGMSVVLERVAAYRYLGEDVLKLETRTSSAQYEEEAFVKPGWWARGLVRDDHGLPYLGRAGRAVDLPSGSSE